MKRAFTTRLLGFAGSVALLILPFTGMGSAQTERWVYTHQEPSSRNDAYCFLLTLGRDGNVYAAGSEFNGSRLEDFLVVSLTPDSGRQRWHYVYNPQNNADIADAGLLYAPDGNLYVGGVSSIHTVCDLAVVSLDTLGGQRWTYDYNGTGNGQDWANAGPVWGGDGNLYACGQDMDTGAMSNRAVALSLTTLGSRRWVYGYDLPNTADAFNDVAWGADGNVYVCGQAGYRTGLGQGFFVVSLASDSGQERWTHVYDGVGEAVDQANSLVCGPDSSVYVCGYINGTITGGNRDLTVVCLTSQDSVRWVYTFNGPANRMDSGVRIRFGPDGNLYVAGYSSNGTDLDGIVVSLTPEGEERWVYRYDSGPGDDDFLDFVFDPAGRIFAAGVMGDAGSGSGWLSAVCLNLDGQHLWDYAYLGALGLAYDVAYGNDGSLYLGGATMASSGWVAFTVIGLDARAGVEEANDGRGTLNPGPSIFRGVLVLGAVGSTQNTGQWAELLDAAGRKVLDLKPGANDVSHLSPGVYFVREEPSAVSGKPSAVAVRKVVVQR